MARVSTHVLDIAKGMPAEGVLVDLYFGGKLMHSARTNADGRTDPPLLSRDRIDPGQYELVFHAGEYFRSAGPLEPAFFEDIAIQFQVGDPEGNYHIPLLLAPHGYSTYRGS